MNILSSKWLIFVASQYIKKAMQWVSCRQDSDKLSASRTDIP